MSDSTAIEVKNIHKTFKIPLDGGTSLKQKIVHFAKKQKGYREFSPLNGVSFEIKKGEFFGIVGRNGSGKSTLLKTIAGIYQPDKGHVKVDGLLIPFIELGVGFNPELTGRENVFLNGALLGFSRNEMEAMYDEIVEFAELQDFMDERLKNYSSGMQVRLAFSIAIRAQGDILLLDEVLAVGDAAFQQKCFDYFASLKDQRKTVILVTHSMSMVRRFCTKALLLNSGKIEEYGDIDAVVKKYEYLNAPKEKPRVVKKVDGEWIDYSLRVKSLEGQYKDNYKPEDKIVIEALLKPKQDIKDAFVGITIQKKDGEYVYWKTTEDENFDLLKDSEVKIDLALDNIFGDNRYTVNLIVRSMDRSTMYLEAEKAVNFRVYGWGRNGWMLHPGEQMDISITNK